MVRDLEWKMIGQREEVYKLLLLRLVLTKTVCFREPEHENESWTLNNSFPLPLNENSETDERIKESQFKTPVEIMEMIHFYPMG